MLLPAGLGSESACSVQFLHQLIINKTSLGRKASIDWQMQHKQVLGVWTMPLLMTMLSHTMQLEHTILTTIANKTCTGRRLETQAQPSLKK